MANRRALIIRPGAIGDFITALPAMQSLRAGYTEVWAAGTNLPLARFADRARSITASGLDRLGITDARDVTDELRTFDSIVSWYGANRPEFRQLVQQLGLPFTFHQALPSGADLHATDFFLDQVNGPPGAVPQLQLPPAPRENFAVVHPFSGSAAKNWPLPRFREIAHALAAQMPVQWCRGPEDPLPAAVCIPDLYRLACWLSRARLFIGNDSGITHLAAAAGTPVLALFGPSDPRVWAPRGPRVSILQRSSMNEISVTDVAEAIQRVLR